MLQQIFRYRILKLSEDGTTASPIYDAFDEGYDQEVKLRCWKLNAPLSPDQKTTVDGINGQNAEAFEDAGNVYLATANDLATQNALAKLVAVGLFIDSSSDLRAAQSQRNSGQTNSTTSSGESSRAKSHRSLFVAIGVLLLLAAGCWGIWHLVGTSRPSPQPPSQSETKQAAEPAAVRQEKSAPPVVSLPPAADVKTSLSAAKERVRVSAPATDASSSKAEKIKKSRKVDSTDQGCYMGGPETACGPKND